MAITPVFLLSLPRSGSTFTQRVIAAHDGISTTSEPWIYGSDGARRHYPEFRRKVDRMLAGPVFDDAMADEMRSALRPFDLAFEWSAEVSLPSSAAGAH